MRRPAASSPTCPTPGSAPRRSSASRFDGTKPLAATGAPELGAGSAAVLAGLGLAPADIADLTARGIVRTITPEAAHG
jgi:crotonobetainyl-CoA:carnitine CoA-transferase CaiB-like acyl-CoA transferase